MKKLTARFWRVAVAGLITLGLYLAFGQLPPLLPCTDHAAEGLTLALCIGMGCYLLLGGRSPWLVGSAVIVIVLTLWLNTDPLRPFRPSPLLGFDVLTQSHGSVGIAPGAILTLAAGKPAALQVRTSLQNVRCRWMSAKGGVFDDLQSCATVYVPPQSETDIVKVSLQPGCGLPNDVEQIRISILP